MKRIIDEDIDLLVKSEGTRTIQYPVGRKESLAKKIMRVEIFLFMLTPSSVWTLISDGSPKCYSASMR